MTKLATVRDPDLVRFGSQVRMAREQQGLLSKEFAKELGISRHTLQNIESGRTRASGILYWRVADALGLDPRDVLRVANYPGIKA